MDFKDYFFGLSADARDKFAQQAGTSTGYLTQVSYRNKRLELGFADVLCALSGGVVSLDDLPLTDNATRQREIRSQFAKRSPAKRRDALIKAAGAA